MTVIFYIYKYVLNDEILYIGKTKRNLNLRINEHTTKKDLPNGCDIYYFECTNESAMNIMELMLIAKYHPKYNKDCNVDDGYIPKRFKEPGWLSYKKYFTPVFIRFFHDKTGVWAEYKINNRIIKKKPEYCDCEMNQPFTEYFEKYNIDRCRFCGRVIRNTFKEH